MVKRLNLELIYGFVMIVVVVAAASATVPFARRVAINGTLHLFLGNIDWMAGLGIVEQLAHRAWATRCDAILQRHVVAFANAARRESEPIREYATAFVVRIVGEQTMQAILLLAATAVATVHLLVLVRALLPVHVLLERIQIEQCQHFAARIVRPEWCDHFLLHRTGIPESETKQKLCSNRPTPRE